jgi:hypothetical protein
VRQHPLSLLLLIAAIARIGGMGVAIWMYQKLAMISLLNALISVLMTNGNHKELSILLELRRPDDQSCVLRSLLSHDTSGSCRNRNEE